MDLSNLSKETLITIIEDQQKLINEQQKKINSYKIPKQPANFMICEDTPGCMARIIAGGHRRCNNITEDGEALCNKCIKSYYKPSNKKLRDGWWGVYGEGCNNADGYTAKHREWSRKQYFWVGPFTDNRPAWVQEKYPLQ
jgi:hypothetical protein